MSTITSASEQSLDFMTLLVTELQNQNPLEPMDNKEMASQLAQFSQLELTEENNASLSEMNETMQEMSSNFMGAMLVSQLEYARTLLGENVSFYSDQYGQTVTGTADKITIEDNIPVLTVTGSITNPDGSVSSDQFVVNVNQIESIGL